MRKWWNNLRIQYKIVIPVLIISAISGVTTYWYFTNLYRETEINALVNKARAVVLSAESAREYSAEQIRYNVFQDARAANMTAEQVLRTVPIFSAMSVAKKKADELGFTLKVPKFSPRNPDNQPDDYEATVLRKLESGSVPETWEVQKETNKIRYFRPVKLTEECMRCHGDPAKSQEYWGRSDGKDITGGKMENWRVGEVHGAFEVMMSMQPVEEAASRKSFIIAGIAAVSSGAIVVVMFIIAGFISRPIQAMEAAARNVAQGNFDVHLSAQGGDEVGSLTASFAQMVQTIDRFVQEQQAMTNHHEAGMISYTMPVEQFQGKYAEMARRTNELAHSHIAVQHRIVEVISQYAVGNFSVDMDKLPGEKAKITQGMDTVKANLKSINDEILVLVDAAVKGNLSKRGEAHKFQHTFREMIQGLNNLLDAIVTPLNVAATCVDRISKGDIPPRITEQYNGDFNAIKTNLNTLIDTLNAFVAAQQEMARQHDAGMISYRMNAEQFAGVYAQMVRGTNELVAAHIAVNMRVVEVISQYAIGNFGADMDRLPGEKAKITQSIDEVKANLQRINREIIMLAQAAVDGKLSTRADANKFQYTFREMVEGINKTLDAVIHPTNEGVQVLQSMAGGNMTKEMKGDYRGDHAVLKNALNSTLQSINTALSQVIATANQVLQGSQQVSAASQALSQGATEQAASLEEISSSMHQIASQTNLNAENANQANQLAIHSRESAERGNSDMAALIQAMQEINESSKNISRIIKVIDEIAFQTNLLALNAAVEAARAGRHGKGFAVVAEEVRNLAARSAKAAKETAEMIEGAVRKAENGSEIARRTAEGLKEIVSGSTKVTDIVGEIAAASSEQAQGISQINTGLSQIDKVTQQNTASAEECAAAAEELSGQAMNLTAMLSRFQLQGGNAQGVHHSVRSGEFSAPRSSSVGANGNTGKSHLLMPHDVIKLDDDDFGRY